MTPSLNPAAAGTRRRSGTTAAGPGAGPTLPAAWEAVLARRLMRYRELTQGQGAATLRRLGISVLPGLAEQVGLVRRFIAEYWAPVQPAGPRIALCGINPGRLGAGKTGLPFLDFHTLAGLLPGIERREREPSAQFVARLIGHYAPRRFFGGVLLTNLAGVGFVGEGRNVNFDGLPEAIQRPLLADFAEEMALLRPRAVVPLGRLPAARLAGLAAAGMLAAPVAAALPHPRYGAFPSHTAPVLRAYRDVLDPILGGIPAENGRP